MKNIRSPSVRLLSSKTKYHIVQCKLVSGEDIVGLIDRRTMDKNPDVLPIAYPARVYTVVDGASDVVCLRMVKMFSTDDLFVTIKKSAVATVDMVTPNHDLVDEYRRYIAYEQKTRMLRNFDQQVAALVASNGASPWFHPYASPSLH